jgi:putative transcriptional regulator
MDLVGKCLIARPNIIDPFFKRSVVYIYEQTTQGIAGIVTNIRKSKITTHDIFVNRGFTPSEPPEKVYQGGPVNENTVILLHTSDWRSSNTLCVNDKISVTSDDLMFYKFLNGNKPNGYKFCTGVAAWHTQQIAAELKANHWLVSDLSPHDILDLEGRTQWDTAIEINARDTIDRYI